MAKQLSDFVIRVNLDGWYCKGYGTCRLGEEISGDKIVERMVLSLESKDQFKLHGSLAPVCVLRGGTVDELKAAMKLPAPVAAVKPEPAQAPKIDVKPTHEPKRVAKPILDEDDEDEKDEDDDDKDEKDEDDEDEDEDEKPVAHPVAAPKKVKRSRRPRVG